MRFRLENHIEFGVVAAVALTLSGCIGIGGGGSGIFARTASKAALSQNCEIPDSFAVKNINRRLAAEGTVVGPDFCAKIESYACYRRVFSPIVAEGASVEEECTQAVEVGGPFCMKLDSRNYNTREATLLAETPTSATQPGGEFNRSEYVCHHKELKDGETYLAVGEGELLKDAVVAAFGKCTGVSPRLTSIAGEK
jgi:hypothetical protein